MVVQKIEWADGVLVKQDKEKKEYVALFSTRLTLYLSLFNQIGTNGNPDLEKSLGLYGPFVGTKLKHEQLVSKLNRLKIDEEDIVVLKDKSIGQIMDDLDEDLKKLRNKPRKFRRERGAALRTRAEGRIAKLEKDAVITFKHADEELRQTRARVLKFLKERKRFSSDSEVVALLGELQVAINAVNVGLALGAVIKEYNWKNRINLASTSFALISSTLSLSTESMRPLAWAFVAVGFSTGILSEFISKDDFELFLSNSVFGKELSPSVRAHPNAGIAGPSMSLPVGEKATEKLTGKLPHEVMEMLYAYGSGLNKTLKLSGEDINMGAFKKVEGWLREFFLHKKESCSYLLFKIDTIEVPSPVLGINYQKTTALDKLRFSCSFAIPKPATIGVECVLYLYLVHVDNKSALIRINPYGDLKVTKDAPGELYTFDVRFPAICKKVSEFVTEKNAQTYSTNGSLDANMCKTAYMRFGINECSGLFAKRCYTTVTCEFTQIIILLKIGSIYNQSRYRYESYALK